MPGLEHQHFLHRLSLSLQMTSSFSAYICNTFLPRNFAMPNISQVRSPIQRPQTALPRRPNALQHGVTNSPTQFVNVQERPATDVAKVSDR